MKKSNLILFPTDFSEASANAFRYALEMANQLASEILIVNAVLPMEAGGDATVASLTIKAQVEAAENAIARFVDVGLAQVFPNLENAPFVTKKIDIGSAEAVINRTAKEKNADFILIGSRGENRNFVDKLIGSVAAGVVKNAKNAVIVIPENAVYRPITKVAYATETKTVDPFEIWKSIKLLEPYTPIVNLVHVDMEKEGDLKAWEMMDDLKEYFEGHAPGMQIKFHYLIGEKLEDELNEFTEDHDIDLLIMYQPKRNFWEKLFYTSDTKKMAMKSQKPVLVQKD